MVNHYDLIFMDHMMPEIDGIETTHIIRRFHEEYNDVPIIALTANAVEEMRSMFLCEGMNDFIAKPIEIPFLLSKLKQWLPKEKIKAVSCENSAAPAEKEKNASSEGLPPDIKGLDTHLALHYLGTEKLFWEVLKDFFHAIEHKASSIETAYKAQDWERFAIEVHALKSAARQIGAIELSDLAAELEIAARENRLEPIYEKTEVLLQNYRNYLNLLQPYFSEKKEVLPKSASSPELLRPLFDVTKKALDDLDMDEMEKILSLFLQYSYPPQQEELCKALENAVEQLDAETCEDIILTWEQLLD